MVRDKWTRRRTTRNHLHHRGFYFHEAFAVQEITDTVDHLITDHERSAGIFVGDQIQVTLTAARLLIGQTFMLFWQRTQSLGQQTDAGGVHRQLTSVSAEHVTFNTNDVTQVPFFELFVVKTFWQIITGYVDLNFAAHILQGSECRFTHDTTGHDTTSDLDVMFFCFQFFLRFLTECFMQITSDLFTTEIVRERITLGAQLGQFGTALRHFVVEFLNVQFIFRCLVLF